MGISASYTVWVGWNYEVMTDEEMQKVLDKGIEEIYKFEQAVGCGIIVKYVDSYDAIFEYTLASRVEEAFSDLKDLGLDLSNVRVWEIVDFGY